MPWRFLDACQLSVRRASLLPASKNLHKSRLSVCSDVREYRVNAVGVGRGIADFSSWTVALQRQEVPSVVRCITIAVASALIVIGRDRRSIARMENCVVRGLLGAGSRS